MIQLKTSESTVARRLLPLLLAAVLCAVMLTGCMPQIDVKTVLRGTLYADSTMILPLAGDTLVVMDSKLGKVGVSLTDDSGHFAFSYWSNGIDANPEAKFQIEYPPVFLCRHGDTLWAGESHVGYNNIVLYPGIDWKRGGWYAK